MLSTYVWMITDDKMGELSLTGRFIFSAGRNATVKKL